MCACGGGIPFRANLLFSSPASERVAAITMAAFGIYFLLFCFLLGFGFGFLWEAAFVFVFCGSCAPFFFFGYSGPGGRLLDFEGGRRGGLHRPTTYTVMEAQI